MCDWWEWSIRRTGGPLGRVSIGRDYWRTGGRRGTFYLERFALDTIGLDGVE
jgi:hypothetical protein